VASSKRGTAGRPARSDAGVLERRAASGPERSAAGELAALSPLRGADEPVIHVGVDENGLGPVLGPMLVTGVAVRVRGARPSSLGALVGDSKDLVSHGDVALGEAWARALLGALGPEPRTPAEIVARVSIDDEATLLAPCPEPARARDATHPSALCWPLADDVTFSADDALVARCRRIVQSWSSSERIDGRFARRTPLEVVGVRAAFVCASKLNDEGSAGRNKFLVDLRQMERVALALHAGSATQGEPLDAVCGKVGGMNSYAAHFGPLSAQLCAIETEGRAISSYRFPGLGRFTWLRDADASDPLVGLASLVGKYLRELAMERIVRFLRAASPDPEARAAIPAASGYHDPTTKRFMLATVDARAARRVPERCFRRNA
jgi:hypothetical protein